MLYDPQPPPNSAYVRVINAVPGSAIDVSVDGRPRVAGIATGEASDYLVLPAGKRTFAVALRGRSTSVTMDIAAGRAMSLAFHGTAGEARPWVFEDKANTNKLKAVLAVYHLVEGGTAVDVLTADGATRVFSDVRPGTSSGLSVNPVKVDLVASAPGTRTPLARASLAMAPGGTYSVLLFPGARGELAARAMHNMVERYTGKPATTQ